MDTLRIEIALTELEKKRFTKLAEAAGNKLKPYLEHVLRTWLRNNYREQLKLEV
jgi:hypothetical protein